MPRQRSSRPASRPTQTRSASTYSAPSSTPQYRPAPAAQQPHPHQSSTTNTQAPPVAQPQQPGLLGQMAATAAGVGIGSAIGHTVGAGISSLFGGSSSAPAEQPAQQQQVQAEGQQALSTQQSAYGVQTCDADARSLTRCLDQNSGNMQICEYYLNALKACQDAAKQY